MGTRDFSAVIDLENSFFLPQFQFLRKSQSQLAYTRETIRSIVTVLTQAMLILLPVAKILVKRLTFTDDRRYSDI